MKIKPEYIFDAFIILFSVFIVYIVSFFLNEELRYFDYVIYIAIMQLLLKK